MLDESYIRGLVKAGCRFFLLLDYTPTDQATEGWVLTDEQRDQVSPDAFPAQTLSALFIAVPWDELRSEDVSPRERASSTSTRQAISSRVHSRPILTSICEKPHWRKPFARLSWPGCAPCPSSPGTRVAGVRSGRIKSRWRGCSPKCGRAGSRRRRRRPARASTPRPSRRAKAAQ